MIYVSKYILHRFRIVCPVIAYHINVDDFVSFREMFLVSQQQQQDRIQYIYRYIYMDESGWEDKYERNNEIRRALMAPPKTRNLFVESKEKLKYSGKGNEASFEVIKKKVSKIVRVTFLL